MKQLFLVLLVQSLAWAQPPNPAGQPAPPQNPRSFGQQRPGNSQQQQVAQRPPTKPEDLSIVEGQIVNGATGEPLSKAKISLRRAEFERDAMGLPGVYSATSDTTGRFTIPNVEPGKYRLSATRTGFVDADFGSKDVLYYGTTFSLAARQRKSDILFRMTPNAVITGKVLDEDSEPMQSVQVEAVRYRYSQGRKELSSYGSATTNDIGEYRISGLPPGKYFVSVAPRRGFFGGRGGGPGQSPVPRPPSTQEPESAYTLTFFPGTPDAASAVPIDLAPGGKMGGVDFSLTKRQTVIVRGRVAGVPATQDRRGGRPTVSLIPRDPAASNARPSGTVDVSGNFEIRSVTPGAYQLVAFYNSPNNALAARMPLDVGTSNVDNVGITLQPPMALNGRLSVEGQKDATFTNVRLSLRPREPGGPRFGPPLSVQVKPDGTFALPNVLPETYLVALSGLPDGLYMKSLLINNQDVLYTGLDLTKGIAGEINVVLRPNAGLAEGVVQGDQQQPAPRVTIVLVPQEPERRTLTQYYKTAVTDDAGHFAFKNVDPGDYRVYAWSDVEGGAYMDPDFVRPVESFGETLKIKEGSTETVQPKLIR